MLEITERRANIFPRARERRRGLILREDFKDKVTATRAKARISHPKMGDTLGLLAKQCRGHVSIATSLDT